MAPTFCTRCGHRVSTNAAKCPGCGTPPYQVRQATQGAPTIAGSMAGVGSPRSKRAGVVTRLVDAVQVLVDNPRMILPSLVGAVAAVGCGLVMLLAVLLLGWLGFGAVWIRSSLGSPSTPSHLLLLYGPPALACVIIFFVLMPIPTACSAATMVLAKGARTGSKKPVRQALGLALARRGAVCGFLVEGFMIWLVLTSLMALVGFAALRGSFAGGTSAAGAGDPALGPLAGLTAGILFWFGLALLLPSALSGFALFYALPEIILLNTPAMRAVAISTRISFANPAATASAMTAIFFAGLVALIIGWILVLVAGTAGALISLVLHFAASACYWVIISDAFGMIIEDQRQVPVRSHI